MSFIEMVVLLVWLVETQNVLEDSMREPCLDCVIKHLGQAFVTNIEYHMGYPDHILLTIGHLAEASEECFGKNAEIANRIRQERLSLMDSYDYEVPYFELYNMVNDFAMATEDQEDQEETEEDLKSIVASLPDMPDIPDE